MLRIWPQYQDYKKSLKPEIDNSITSKVDKFIKNLKSSVRCRSSILFSTSIDTEINCRIGKVSGTSAGLSKRVWDVPNYQ